jgi:membrane-anchored protein YejM (alkaline phosphatase superfamily)
MAEANEAVKAEAAAEAPPEPRWLFFVISFLVPIAGIVLGALYLSKPDAPSKEFGKYCLIAALVNFGIGFSVILCMVLFYAAFFAVYLGLIMGLIGAAAGGGM